MSEENVPAGLRYAPSHEWIRVEGDVATVGITDHAQAQLTDIVFVELPTVGKEVGAGATVVVLESVKTVADVYAPGPGTVTEGNAGLAQHPEWINQDPYGKGWLFKIRLTGPLQPDLMDDAGYRAQLARDG